MTIKSISLSSQYNFYKIKNINKMQLKQRIKKLKEKYIENQMEIFELEGRLSNIVNNDLKNEFKNVRNFEKLNDEKITPYFMARAKQPNSCALLSDIRGGGNRDFIDNTERETYITDYYRDVYKKKTLGA